MIIKNQLYTRALFLLVTTLNAQAMEFATTGICKLLPVNHLLPAGQKTTLLIRVPENFRPLGDPMQPFAEFIPKMDADVNNWSEIITLQTVVGKRVPASYLVDALKQQFAHTAGQFRVLYQSVESMATHAIATLVIKYMHNNRKEIMLARYVSGSYDCAGFQYAIDATNKPQADVVTALEDFAEEQTSLIKF